MEVVDCRLVIVNQLRSFFLRMKKKIYFIVSTRFNICLGRSRCILPKLLHKILFICTDLFGFDHDSENENPSHALNHTDNNNKSKSREV